VIGRAGQAEHGIHGKDQPVAEPLVLEGMVVHHPQGEVDTAGVDGVVDRRQQVFVLGGQAPARLDLVRPEELPVQVWLARY
jgi:hypothetical protein